MVKHLEDINRKIEGDKTKNGYSRNDEVRRSVDSRELEKRLKEMEKESDLKFTLMKQQ